MEFSEPTSTRVLRTILTAGSRFTLSAGAAIYLAFHAAPGLIEADADQLTETIETSSISILEPAKLDDAQAWVCGAPSLLEKPAMTADRFLASAADERTPWMAKLEIVEHVYEDGAMSISNCGAAAINRDWLVTAAHCVGGARWVSIRATLGARNLASVEAVRRAASVALCHDQFDPGSLSHDVALLRLARPLPANFPTIRIASSVESERLSADDLAVSAGWGRISSTEISQVLRRSEVRIVDPASEERGGMIVATPTRDVQSLCVGESGAPLVSDQGLGAAVFGVFSSVDAIVQEGTGELTELCDGFEARSYFTPVTGLQNWIAGAINACESDLDACTRRRN